MAEQHRHHFCFVSEETQAGPEMLRNQTGPQEPGHLSYEPLATVRGRTVSNCSTNWKKGRPQLPSILPPCSGISLDAEL